MMLTYSRKLVFPIIMLFMMGLIMIFNTSSAEILDHFGSKTIHGSLLKQLAYGVAGILFGVMTYRVGFQKLIDLSPKLVVIFSLLLLAVFIPGVGIQANGAKRWVGIAGISLQPSEFFKYTALLYFIYRVKTSDPIQDFQSFIKLLLPLTVPLGLILLEPNNGTVAVIMVALSSLFFMSKIPLRFWALPIVSCMLVITTFALHMPYVAARFQVYLHPELDLKGKGHQPHQAKIASGSGGFFGKGPGKSVQKLSYLPEAQNDYIAAIYAEEYGFVGILGLLFAYGYLTYLGLQIAMKANSHSGMYVAASFTFLLALQAFLNLGVVSGLLPSTGLNLPFFSQGGSSLIANCGALGCMMSIHKEEVIAYE